MNRLIEFFKKYPEVISIPLALIAWRMSIDVLRWFDSTSGTFDAGVFQIPLFALIQYFIYVSMAWLTVKLLFGTLRRFLRFDFKNEFNGLTSWQKIKLSYFVFFALLFSLVLLSHTLGS